MSFPYSAGATLAGAVRTREDPAATSLLRRLPRSTAQVLDPALYRSDEQPREARLDLAGRMPGSTAVYATTLGAANLNLLGELHGGGEPGRGWRGDRLETVRRGGRPRRHRGERLPLTATCPWAGRRARGCTPPPT
jgi:hypothetical protein